MLLSSCLVLLYFIPVRAKHGPNQPITTAYKVSVKYRVDPRGDRDMAEGCPLLKKIGGRKYVPVGLHLGRYTGAFSSIWKAIFRCVAGATKRSPTEIDTCVPHDEHHLEPGGSLTSLCIDGRPPTPDEKKLCNCNRPK